jgi:PBP1b-binding outer membrane lipoprotein LpoB
MLSLMKSFYIILLAMFFTAGCGNNITAVKTDKMPQTNRPSIAREAIEGLTGKTAVNDLKRAKGKIVTAGEKEKQKQQDVDELSKP